MALLKTKNIQKGQHVSSDFKVEAAAVISNKPETLFNEEVD